MKRTLRCLLTGALVAGALAPRPAAAGGCSFDAEARVVRVAAPAGRVVMAVRSDGHIAVNGVVCARHATVLTVDRIQVEGSPSSTTMTIGGAERFSPGATPEIDGTSEIEFDLRGGAGRDALVIRGSRDADRISVAGASADIYADGDRDVFGDSFERITLSGGKGRDVLLARSPGGEGLDVRAGGGDDRVEAGSGRQRVHGGRGDDRLLGGRGADRLSGGPGNDPLLGGRGTDTCKQSLGMARRSSCEYPRFDTIAGFRVVAGESRRVGSGPLRTFIMEVEKGLRIPDLSFASKAQDTLLDRRSWVGENVSLRRVESGTVSFRVTLASPDTVDRLCAPLDTNGIYSCFNGYRAVINAWRWTNGAESFGSDLKGYRRYLVNHEVGHALGHGHRSCPGPGRPAPVMMQQTIGVGACDPNPWPLAWEQGS